jgi:hypothetical protein
MTTDLNFDPWAIIGALERHRVNYVLIGGLAGVLHGTDEITSDVDICPQMKGENIDRLQSAVEELGGRVDLEVLASQPLTPVRTDAGELKVVPEPPGSSGWDDLRRGSTREALGRGIRAPVASVNDLGRLMTSLGRDDDSGRLAVIRRLAELEPGRGIER